MGMSATAKLVYGYHLGGDELGWDLEGLDEYESPTFDWYDPEDEDGDGFSEAVETELLVQLGGFTETDWQAEGYWDRRKEAGARVGVEVETYCSYDYPGYLLSAKTVTAYQGQVEEIDFDASAQADADVKLRAALDTLGIRPTQERARWLLCSIYG